MSVALGDKWTAAIIITKQGLKPEAQVFSLVFYKARELPVSCNYDSETHDCSKEKEELHYKGKNFRRSITPHHKFDKKQNRGSCNRKSTKVYIAHVNVFLC